MLDGDEDSQGRKVMVVDAVQVFPPADAHP